MVVLKDELVKTAVGSIFIVKNKIVGRTTTFNNAICNFKMLVLTIVMLFNKVEVCIGILLSLQWVKEQEKTWKKDLIMSLPLQVYSLEIVLLTNMDRKYLEEHKS